MENLPEKIHEATAFLKENGFTGAGTAIILGTGLEHFIDKINVIKNIDYNAIPHFVSSTVTFHKGRLILGQVAETRVIVLQGRFHYYEGYSMQQITFPVRVMQSLGIKRLLITNAAGGINSHYKKGDFVLLQDHINLLPENPLRGLNSSDFGNLFVDMSQPYDYQLSNIIKAAAAQQNIPLHEGIYASVPGPNLETRAEYRYLRIIGADMVGMSTVPEVIVANHVGLPCAAISVITDECNPDDLHPVNIAEIIAVAARADKKLSGLLEAFVLSN